MIDGWFKFFPPFTPHIPSGVFGSWLLLIGMAIVFTCFGLIELIERRRLALDMAAYRRRSAAMAAGRGFGRTHRAHGETFALIEREYQDAIARYNREYVQQLADTQRAFSDRLARYNLQQFEFEDPDVIAKEEWDDDW